MDNPEDDGWQRAWMDWLKKRQRCQVHLASEGSVERRLGVSALFVVVTLLTSAVTTLCVLERWSGGEERKWDGGKEVLRMVGKEINIQLNRFGPEIHFTLQTSSRNDDEGVLIGWRNAQYSLSEDRAYVVPATDYYMIYTCLSFVAPPSKDDVVFWQELWRHSQGGASGNKVLKDVQIERCDQQSGTASAFCHRSLIFGILRLRKDDRIYVRTSHPNLVSRTNGTSYFGVLKMS